MSTSLRAFRNLRNIASTNARALPRRTNFINARNFSSAVAMPSAVPAASGTQPTRQFSALSRDSQISDAPGGFGTRKFREIDFKIVDSTLREGEQFSTAFFSTDDKIHIATQLNEIGVEYIELVTPMASKQSFEDCKKIAKLGLKAKVVTHVRCHMDDVKAAIESGVQGVNMYMATSAALRKHSHGKGIDYIIETAKEVIQYAQKFGVETRFSCEDTFRSDMSDLLRVYSAMDKLGVHRVGLADTVGVATPMQVYHTARTVRNHVSCDIEFHTHDDTGCCIANALLAIQGGVTHIDTCVLGIGERNGITPLGGFLARMYTLDKDTVRTRYNLPLLRDLELFVARKANIDIPFNNYVTGSSAFTHKAGVHSKAVMQNPSSYEVLDPRDFGVERQIQIAHRLTGWNAVKQRCIQLGLTSLSDDKIKEATQYIKNLADTRDVTTEDLDGKLREMDAVARQQGQAQQVHARRQVQQAARA